VIEFIIEEDGVTRRVELQGVPVHIGRAEEAEIRLDNHRVSRHHARVDQVGDAWILHDLDSSNGTRVNGESVTRTELRRGDRIEVGSAVLTLVRGDAAATAEDSLPELPGIEVLDDLGLGLASRVYLARQDALHRKVAVKVLRERWRTSKAVVLRFTDLARRQARLQHPGLASGIDIGEVEGIPYFVVEHLEGDTVGARVRGQMAFDPSQTVRVIERVLGIVTYVHSQGSCVESVHPESVILGDDQEVWLTGVGFPLPSYRMVPDEQRAELGYLPPEIEETPSRGSPRGDIYQIGNLAAFLLTGRHPREGPTTQDVLAALQGSPTSDLERARYPVPEPLRAFIENLRDPDPARRPATAADALDALQKVKGEMERIAARRQASAEDLETRSPDGAGTFRRSARFILVNRVITVVIAIALNVGFFLWWQGRDGDRSRPSPAPFITPVTEGDGDQHPRVQPGPESGSSRRENLTDAANAAYARLEETVQDLMDDDKFEAATRAASAYVERYGGTAHAQRGITLVQTVGRRHAKRAEEMIAALETALQEGNLRRARAELPEARRVGATLLGRRLDAIEKDLAKREELAAAERRAKESESAEGEGESGTGSRESETGRTSGTGKPDPKEITIGESLQALAQKPLDPVLRRKILDATVERPPPAEAAPWIRALQAFDRCATAWSDSLTGSIGGTIGIQTLDGKSVEGVLLGVDEAGITLDAKPSPRVVPWAEVSGSTLVRMLNTEDAGLDQYLTRALLHLVAREDRDAWFDLQAVRLLGEKEEDSDARQLAELELERLARGKGSVTGPR
jgi:hypothetical protein